VVNWNQIVNANAESVLAAAFRILGNLSDAEDISQDVFAEAFRKWKPNSDQNWGGLLRRIAVCRAIDQLRKRKIAEPFLDPVLDHSAAEPFQIAADRELQETLRTAVSELPPREAQIFCLVHFESLPHKTVAQQLGISSGAVAKGLSKAKSKLTEKFGASRTGELK